MSFLWMIHRLESSGGRVFFIRRWKTMPLISAIGKGATARSIRLDSPHFTSGGSKQQGQDLAG